METKDIPLMAANTAGSAESATNEDGGQSKAGDVLSSKLKCKFIQRIVSARFIELFFALIIAVATVVNVWVTRQQWMTMRDSNEINRESFTSVQRPFVTAKEIQKRFELEQLFLQVTVENSGNTPTRAMQYFVSYTENSDVDPEVVFRSTEANGRRFRGIIGPKTMSSLVGSLVGVPASHIADLADRRSDFYLYGVVHYSDWFSDTSEHLTKFCFVGQPFKRSGVVDVAFLTCNYWNCADDDCEREKTEFEHLSNGY